MSGPEFRCGWWRCPGAKRPHDVSRCPGSSEARTSPGSPLEGWRVENELRRLVTEDET